MAQNVEVIVGHRGSGKTDLAFLTVLHQAVEEGRMTQEEAQALVREVSEAFGPVDDDSVRPECLCCGGVFDSDSGDSYYDECAEASCFQISLGDENTPCNVTGE